MFLVFVVILILLLNDVFINSISLHKILLTLTDDILHSKLNENNKMNILKKLGEIEKKINITNDEKPYINELSSIHILLDKVGF